jgi:hypothetical protein
MAEIDNEINRLLNTSNDETWTRLTDYILSSDYEDEEGPVNVIGRSIGDVSEEISVQGESNAQYITFIIPRYYDGIDIKDMTINIHYELSDESGSNDYPVNAYYSDEHIKFGWIIPPAAVMYEGAISFCIFAAGIKDNKQYLLKTETKKYIVKSGLDITTGIPEPDENWYVNFILRLEAVTEDLIQEAEDTIRQYAQQYLNIDTQLDPNSGNVVANSAITAAINTKQDKATVQDRKLIL